MIRVETPSRIHITLIDLNGSIGRIDGGIGIALKEPKIVVEIEKSSDFEVFGFLKERARKVAERVLGKLNLEGVRINVKEAYEEHIGLGSGTQLSLAIAKGICEAHGIERSVEELAKIVGRGGTSGIGVNAFHKGGFILDAGHSKKVKKDFLPSSASKAPPPKLLVRYDFPWDIILVFPKNKRKVYGDREVNIFKRYCPIPIEEVRKLSHIVLMKVLPSIVEEDIESFGEAINEIQNIGFKKIEVDLQNNDVKELLKLCQKYSYGAGLSSFGPTIYCIAEKEIVDFLKKDERIEKIIVTKPNNVGAKIEKI